MLYGITRPQWDIDGISFEIAMRWMPQDLTDGKSTLVQVITLADVDPNLCHTMISLGHNELIIEFWYCNNDADYQ